MCDGNQLHVWFKFLSNWVVGPVSLVRGTPFVKLIFRCKWYNRWCLSGGRMSVCKGRAGARGGQAQGLLAWAINLFARAPFSSTTCCFWRLSPTSLVRKGSPRGAPFSPNALFGSRLNRNDVRGSRLVPTVKVRLLVLVSDDADDTIRMRNLPISYAWMGAFEVWFISEITRPMPYDNLRLIFNSVSH